MLPTARHTRLTFLCRRPRFAITGSSSDGCCLHSGPRSQPCWRDISPWVCSSLREQLPAVSKCEYCHNLIWLLPAAHGQRILATSCADNTLQSSQQDPSSEDPLWN